MSNTGIKFYQSNELKGNLLYALFQFSIPGMKDALETFVKKPYISVKDQF